MACTDLMGWKVEGAFPNLHEPRLILLGPD